MSTKKGNFISRFYSAHPIISHILLICATICILGWLALVFLDIWTLHGRTTTVPDIKNCSYNEARQLLNNVGLRIEIADSIYDQSTPPGTVIEVRPKAGSVVKPGREVYVTITSFSPRLIEINMPLTNVSSRQALSYLQAQGFSNVRIINVPSQFNDLVEGASFNGKELTPGMLVPINASITLRVGVQTEPEPDQIDVLAQADTIDALTEQMLNE